MNTKEKTPKELITKAREEVKMFYASSDDAQNESIIEDELYNRSTLAYHTVRTIREVVKLSSYAGVHLSGNEDVRQEFFKTRGKMADQIFDFLENIASSR